MTDDTKTTIVCTGGFFVPGGGGEFAFTSRNYADADNAQYRGPNATPMAPTIEIKLAHVTERDGQLYVFQPEHDAPEDSPAGTWWGPIPDRETAQTVADDLNEATVRALKSEIEKAVKAPVTFEPDGPIVLGGGEFNTSTIRGKA